MVGHLDHLGKNRGRMSFILYDISLLVIFAIVVSIILYSKRKNLGIDGSLILYRTKWGIKLIDKIGGKYKKTLRFLSYVSIIIGFLLMIVMFGLIIQTVYIYLTTEISTVIKAPPVMPLIPYFPEIFGLESMFPPFYFIYFIIALIIVATVHEFSHGIFARRYGVKIKSTGFAFLKWFPAIFGAFVEQEEEDMKKKGKIEQMSILSAGVFANVIATIIFFVFIVLFFSVSFAPAGVVFDDYLYSVVEVNSITNVNGVPLENPEISEVLEYLIDGEMNQIRTEKGKFVAVKGLVDNDNIALYNDLPAINAGLNGAISFIGGEKVSNVEGLSSVMEKYSPGETVKIVAVSDEVAKEYVLELGENKGRAVLGIGFFERKSSGILGKVYGVISRFKDPNIYYASNFSFAVFIYDLLWWIILINFAVALFNMLPLGILDGGRFFYLTIWGLTGNEKLGKNLFRGITYFILFLVLLIMVKWIFGFF